MMPGRNEPACNSQEPLRYPQADLHRTDLSLRQARGPCRSARLLGGGLDVLQPPHTATTVRVRNCKREVRDASYADVKQQLGGYVVIEVAGLDAALERAAKSPSAEYGSVEVHPVLPPPAH